MGQWNVITAWSSARAGWRRGDGPVGLNEWLSWCDWYPGTLLLICSTWHGSVATEDQGGFQTGFLAPPIRERTLTRPNSGRSDSSKALAVGGSAEKRYLLVAIPFCHSCGVNPSGDTYRVLTMLRHSAEGLWGAPGSVGTQYSSGRQNILAFIFHEPGFSQSLPPRTVYYLCFVREIHLSSGLRLRFL